ncbi:hypothetical protein M9Y10_012330 [Tritrichomonas musculus]|uniref:Transmembrane protein n=1 Tax=Tritrichomonas musculus TaxID=1915356 RepID=A0ABR2IC80_9EUKA
MNTTITSLILASATHASPFISLPLHYQAQSTISIRSCYFSHFTPTFLKIISPSIQSIDKEYGIISNQRFVIDLSKFSTFLSPAVIVNSIPPGSADCSRIRSFRINQTLVFNQSDTCGLIKRNSFVGFYCSPSVFFVNASNYKLFIDHNNFTACTLCLYVVNGSCEVLGSFFVNCTASKDANNSISQLDYKDQPIYQQSSVVALLDSAFNVMDGCNITDCLPTPIYMSLSSGTFTRVIYQYVHIFPPSDIYLFNVLNCAMVRLNNIVFSYNSNNPKRKDSSPPNPASGGALYIFNSQNVDLFYVFFYRFPSYSLVLKENSYITMNFVCFQKNKEDEIQTDESSSYLILHPRHVVFNPECHFTPLPTTQLTKADRNYGIIALVVFTVFFFCVFVAFIICIFKKKKPPEEVYNALNNEDFSTEDTSRAISD